MLNPYRDRIINNAICTLERLGFSVVPNGNMYGVFHERMQAYMTSHELVKLAEVMSKA